jgi:hypothetical protein
MEGDMEEVDEATVTVCSVKEFHAPQSGQRPVHLGCSLPHCWQTNTVLVLVLGGMYALF